MSKQKKKDISQPSKGASHKHAEKVIKALANEKRRYKWLIVLVLALITFLTYSNSLRNHFVNYDDNVYVYENPLLKSFSPANLKTFFTEPVAGNYHPLTMLSLAIDYHLYGLEKIAKTSNLDQVTSSDYVATGYHLTSLLLHIVSVGLLFFFCLKLFGEVRISVFVALLFALHPMHVESVSWISERKDQLYVLFYFAAMLSYISGLQVRGGRLKYTFLTLLLFILSLLSKGQAVTLPIILLGIDYYRGRRLDGKAIIEKIPFFILSILFGIAAIWAQKSVNAIQDIDHYFKIGERLMFACYATIMYLVKFVLPVHLSVFYPYPQKVGNAYPLSVYLSPLIILLLTGLVIWKFRKNRLVVFGLLFFFANVILLLQLIPVGGAIIADRYTYLSYTGLFFIIAVSINNYLKKNMTAWVKPLVFSVLGLYLIVLASLTYAQNSVWFSGKTLFLNAVKQDKDNGSALGHLGSVYLDEEKVDSAFICLNRSIAIVPNNALTYVNRASVYDVNKKFDSAIYDCRTALKYNPQCAEAYGNMGLAYGMQEKLDSSFNNFTKAVKLKPDMGLGYMYLATIYGIRGQADSAFDNYTKAINYGVVVPNVFYQRSLLYKQKGNYEAALKDALRAKQGGGTIDDNYINSLRRNP